MMRKILLASMLAILFCLTNSYARERGWGYCMQGGHVVVTQGLNSDTKVQQSFQSCTVTVYDEGTTNLSTIYADNSGTVKGNPFTSDANGYWFFYADNGRYDVHFSNSDITTPYTQGDYLLCDPDDATGSFSCTGGGGTSCPLGPTDTRFVDSAAGSDSNNGRNWCSAYATEQTAVDALAATGGWVYVAPDYTNADATGVGSNIHILRTNQFDALGASAQRFGFPDWSDTTENHFGLYVGSSATPAEAGAAFSALGPFTSANLVASVMGNVTVPDAASAYPSEQAGVAGIVTQNASGGNAYQAEGVYGACYDNLSAGQDCTGVVGVAGNGATVTTSYLESMWANLSLNSVPGGVAGLVIRATGQNMPTDAISVGSGAANAAIDIRNPTPGSASAGDQWPTGLYMENWTTTQPIYLGFNYPVVADRGNDGIKLAWQYNSATSEYSQFRVTGSTNTLYPHGGNFQFLNNRVSSTVTLQTDVDGYVQVGAINNVNFTGTDTFDRSLGMIQKITLTANETASSLSNCAAGQLVIFDIIEGGGGGWTFSPPANLHNFGSIDTTAGYHNTQTFYCDGTSSSSGGYATGVMVSGS